MLKKFNSLATAVICSSLISSVVLADGEARDDDHKDNGANYEVTITNLTRAQTFTPILVASHRKGINIFELGSEASAELSTIAESGNPAPLAAAIEADHRSVDVKNAAPLLESTGGLLLPGHSVTVTVSARRGAKEITVASMLIPTNDSFIALNGVKAPKGNKTTVYYSPGYDAGSEPNDEDCLNIPGPVCKGDGPSPEAGGEGYVHISSGIHGIKDLHPNVYDWRNPTAKIVIKRVHR